MILNRMGPSICINNVNNLDDNMIDATKLKHLLFDVCQRQKECRRMRSCRFEMHPDTSRHSEIDMPKHSGIEHRA